MKPRTYILGFAALGALVLVIGVGYLVSRLGEKRTSRVFEVASASVPGSEPEDVELSSAEVARSARSAPTQSEDATAAASVPDRPPVPRATGRVMDLEGRPIAGVAIALRSDPNSPIATSAADGTFDLTTVDVELTVADARWYTLRDTEPLSSPDGAEVLVVVAPAIRVGGRVEDPAGAPIHGAKVNLELPAAAFARFPEPLDRARPARASARDVSGADGRFELEVPSVELAQLVVTAAGWSGTTIDAPRETRFDLVVKLAAPVPSSALQVEGVVVHADGSPGIGATVRYGYVSSTVDSDGRFTLPVGRGIEEGRPLVAVKLGFQPAIVSDFGETVRSSPDRMLPFQHLVLGGPPLAIEGRVVDSEGRPQPGWQVQPVDPLEVVEGSIPPKSVEALIHGAQVTAQSDADGRFRLEGLLDRTYRLQAVSVKALVRIESDPVAAGARNVQLVVSADAHFAAVRGEVVAADGSPVAGVDVRCALIVFRTKSGYTMDHSQAVRTDAQGGFVLTKVPRSSSRIDVTGDAILPAGLDLANHVEGERVRIVAWRRCHARVEGVPADTKLTSFRVQDADGENLQLMQFQSGGWWSSDQVQFTGGISPVFAVSEAARTIVFQGENVAEVSRALVLVPGEITVVRW